MRDDSELPTDSPATQELSSYGFAGVEGPLELEENELLSDRSESSAPAIDASRSLFEGLNFEGLNFEAAEAALELSPLHDVTDTTIPPFRIVAHLELTLGNMTFDGTAFFITDSVLLTAGHNLFFHDAQTAPSKIVVYPGRNGNRGYGRFIPRMFKASDGWIAGNPNSDYGIIALDTPLGARLGKFGVTDLPTGEPDPNVFVSGYPSTRPVGTQSAGVGEVGSVSARRIGYAVATLKGQSGGPLLLANTLRAVGIHVARPGGLAEAIRLTNSVRAEIAGWLQQL